MFICEDCAKKRKMDTSWFIIAPLSRGGCELCNKYAVCLDIHHSQVPDLPTAKGGRNEAEVIAETADLLDVWRIEAKGLGTAYYENDIKIIEDMLKDCDYDEGYIITKHKMSKKEFEELPEFMGF